MPKGYDEHPGEHYPVIYSRHFGLNPPFGFAPGNEFAKAWEAGDFPRMIAVTWQHPTPYFDDSYAVNSANNGPTGTMDLLDAIGSSQRAATP